MRFSTFGALFFWFLPLFTGAAFAEPPKRQDAPALTVLKDFHRRIETEQLGWHAYKASLHIRFVADKTQEAECSGDLVYDRLSERILLHCREQKGKPLFTLKTRDKAFELYLAGPQTLYQGDIFDLNQSQKIDSHIKPLDLYRAFKPMAFENEHTLITPLDRDHLQLKVFRGNPGESPLARYLLATHSGFVVFETYYSPSEEVVLEINRSEFRKISGAKSGTGQSIFFPHRLRLVSGGLSIRTEFQFESVSFFWSLPDETWDWEVPPDTQIINCRL